jgi:hypothetical protein
LAQTAARKRTRIWLIGTAQSMPRHEAAWYTNDFEPSIENVLPYGSQKGLHPLRAPTIGLVNIFQADDGGG